MARWHRRYTVLALCVGAYFAIRFVQLSVSAVLPLVLDGFSVSRAVAGIVLGGMWATYALAQLPSGVLSDRFGPRTVVLVAISFAGSAGVVLAGTPSFALFAVFVALLGAGAGLYYNAATALLTDRFDAIGRAIGIHRIGDPAAGLLAPPALAAVAVRYGWRIAFGIGVCIAGVVGIVFARTVGLTPRRRTERSSREPFALSALFGLLARRELATTTMLAMLAEFVGLATMSLLPTFFVQHHGYTLARAGVLFSALAGIEGVFQPVAGWLSDRLGRDAVFALMMAAGIVGYTTLSLTTAFVLAVPAVGLAGFAMSWAPPLQSRALDVLGAGEQDIGFGLFRTLYVLSGALGTAVTGVVADIAGWGRSFLLLATLFAVALLVLLRENSLDT